MSDIYIKEQQETDSGWIFIVELADGKEDKMTYEVTLYEDDWHEMTGGGMEAEILIMKSFEFLLEHEPKESILRKFNLTVINDYFPEYSDFVKGLLK